MTNKKVVLGMSGGVDSSVSVHLLQQAGYEVIGVHMLMTPESALPEATSLSDARAVAEHFGIQFHVLDIREQFKQTTVRYFTEAYQKGLTPNPCVYCNKTIKFGLFAEEAFKMGADYISTGHYIRKVYDDNYQQSFFAKAQDSKKDQSYFLSLVNPEIVDRCIFPLGDYTKEDVRKIAEKLNLPVAHKKDSQEICFIPNDDYKAYLHANLSPNAFHSGKVLDQDGNILGNHESIMNYTIGQRKGLGIALGKPAYVVEINAQNNTVVLGDEKKLYHNKVNAIENNYFTDLPCDTLIDIEAKIRYRVKPAEAKLIRHKDGRAEVYFADPQRAITPGQCISYYQGDILLGGGWIV